MLINNKFKFGDIVYLKADRVDRELGMLTAIMVTAASNIAYQITWAKAKKPTWHYAIELELVETLHDDVIDKQ